MTDFFSQIYRERRQDADNELQAYRLLSMATSAALRAATYEDERAARQMLRSARSTHRMLVDLTGSDSYHAEAAAQAIEIAERSLSRFSVEVER